MRRTTRIGRLTRALVAVSLGIGTVVATVGTGAVSASAAGSYTTCSARTNYQAFRQWGDTADYFLVPNGSFASGTGSWFGSNISTVAENEPWKVFPSTSNSLKITNYGWATSSSSCVMNNEDGLRFFYKSPGVSGSTLLVTVMVNGSTSSTQVETTLKGDSAGWKVSPILSIPKVGTATESRTVTVTFSARNTTASWQVDDVAIDPWKSL
jgi:hypothetical protein